VRFVLLVLVALLPALSAASTTHGKKAELKHRRSEVRSRIKALHKDLAKSEAHRANAADQLKDIESAISGTGRKLHRLTKKRRALADEADDLKAQSRHLDRQMQAQQAQLSRLLYRQYMRGRSDALQMLLAGRDPNQAALDYQYLKYLSEAKAELIADLDAKAEKKKRLNQVVLAKNAELAAVEDKQRQARNDLFQQRKQKKVLLSHLAKTIKAQRHKIGVLRRNERRLTSLIKSLAKRARHHPHRGSGRAAAPSRGGPDLRHAKGAFAALKGKLHLPVHGRIANRFGSRRPGGATTWKGLRIIAAEGTEVRAVAAGKVVYADWLRGYGNLMIIDHGNGFLSVYGNNESLLKETGDEVKAGEAVATVGSTGGRPDSGLYFELRYQGQAFDPLRWISRR
jgi:murein hydrolase activator